jgi:hypothetical protein
LDLRVSLAGGVTVEADGVVLGEDRFPGRQSRSFVLTSAAALMAAADAALIRCSEGTVARIWFVAAP